MLELNCGEVLTRFTEKAEIVDAISAFFFVLYSAISLVLHRLYFY